MERSIQFFGNGKVAFNTTFLNDIPVGHEYFFDANGDTNKCYTVNSSGKRDFPYKRWLNNGEILAGNFADSTKMVVIWKWYGKDGKVLKTKIQHFANKTFVSPEPN